MSTHRPKRKRQHSVPLDENVVPMIDTASDRPGVSLHLTEILSTFATVLIELILDYSTPCYAFWHIEDTDRRRLDILRRTISWGKGAIEIVNNVPLDSSTPKDKCSLGVVGRWTVPELFALHSHAMYSTAVPSLPTDLYFCF